MNKTPILFWSDAVSASSGLARITRDLAVRVHNHLGEQFRVASVGYGGPGSSRLGFPQYSWHFREDWLMPELPEIWDDFAGNERGILFSIHDLNRVMWMSLPETCADPRLQKWLHNRRFDLWGYFPIDAAGPAGRLSFMLGESCKGFDRILAYTKWAQKILESTLGYRQCEDRQLTNIPHGIDTSVFYPRDRKDARKMVGFYTVGKQVPIGDKDILVGIVATNQARKDFGQAVEVLAELKKRHNVKVWIHTDAVDRYWSIPYLLQDLGAPDAIISVNVISDDVMAQLYSACDVTLGIGLGEGMGYPIFESMACGTPCVHGKYGGAAEYLPPELLVPVMNYRIEGIYGNRRPVFQVGDWVQRIESALKMDREKIKLHPDLDWNGNLESRWLEWFKTGVSSETEVRQDGITV